MAEAPPNEVMRMIAIRRPLIEGAGADDEILKVVSKYAHATLYTHAASQLPKIKRDLIRLLAKELIPHAQMVGKEATGPILRALQGKAFTQRGNRLRAGILENAKLYTRRNLAGLEAVIEREVGTLGGDIKAAFIRAQRDGVARKTLIQNLVDADRSEMTRLRQVANDIRSARADLTKAERAAVTASRRQQRRVAREVRQARDALRKAKAAAAPGRSKTFLARLETAVRGEVRDSIRREAERAQFNYFGQALGDGKVKYTWVTVNGADACPDCGVRHGQVRTKAEWLRTAHPGDGQTVCGQSCQCNLVPEAYAAGRPGLEEPLRVVA